VVDAGKRLRNQNSVLATGGPASTTTSPVAQTKSFAGDLSAAKAFLAPSSKAAAAAARAAANTAAKAASNTAAKATTNTSAKTAGKTSAKAAANAAAKAAANTAAKAAANVVAKAAANTAAKAASGTSAQAAANTSAARATGVETTTISTSTANPGKSDFIIVTGKSFKLTFEFLTVVQSFQLLRNENILIPILI